MAWGTDEVYKYLSGESLNDQVYDISDTQLTLFLVYIILLCIGLLLFLSGCIHSLFNSICKCCKREDNLQYVYMFTFMIYFWEYICDILFISILFINHYHNNHSITDTHNKYTILLWIALGCVAITSLLNVILCCRIIHILYKHNERVSHWFHSCFHSFSFVLLSSFTFGPFISIPLFNSNMFGISLFCMQINKYDIHYILSLKFFNIITQLLPLFFLRILYLFWIKTFNILILSSLLPISLSLCISTCYLCCAIDFDKSSDKYLLRCCFEISAARLSKLRHVGLTKHLQHEFCELLYLKYSEMQLFKPIDCSDSKQSRFEICFIVNSDENTLEKVEDSFCSYSHNEAFAKRISQTYKIGNVYINKQSAEIIERVDILWGAKKQQPAHKQKQNYDAIAAHPAYVENINTAHIYHNGERNINIKSIQAPAGFQPMQSRSSSSFNHPPIEQEHYHNEMQGISEEEEEDANQEDHDESRQLIISRRHNIADASSLSDINILHQTDDPPLIQTPSAKNKNNEDEFGVSSFKPRLSSQELRLQNWERYSIKVNPASSTDATKHKRVATPSFSISAMEGHHLDTSSFGSIIAFSPSRPPPKIMKCNAEQIEMEQMFEIHETQHVSTEEYHELKEELQLNRTVSITHQTKSVIVDPVDVQQALSLQSKVSIPAHMVVLKETMKNNENEIFLDSVSEREDSQTQSVENNAAQIEPEYDQILHKPRTARTSKWEHQNIENKQMLLLQKEAEESQSSNSSDSYDTHTATQTDDYEESSSKSSSSDIVVPEASGAHYEYNKVITINANKND